MSDPKRYSIVADYQAPWAKMHEFSAGGWVKWQDYARLKAEVESLKKPAVIGGYNISEYIRMANSETLEFDNGDIFADMTLPDRIKYIVESNARLKAEVERLRKAGDALVIAHQATIYEHPYTVRVINQCLADWNAAKEGKQS